MSMMLHATAAPPSLLTRAEELASGFHVNPDDVTRISRHFVHQMRNGLGHHGATQMPTFVTRLPTGSEHGLFLAVDLGGTNCRVSSIDLHGDTTFTAKQSKSAIPKELMVNDSYKPLFAYIAREIRLFLNNNHGEYYTSEGEGANGIEKGDLKLGFTFSFTYENVSLAKGIMLQWDKGWHIPDALGRDPCQMLQSAIDELALPVKVSALISDSVGVLMARAYTSPKDSETLIGAIFGTGTNAAYGESLVNVRKLREHEEFQHPDAKSIMVMNTEWGAFDDELVVLPRTSYDDMLDSSSTNPNSQMFEKRVSALYLGELFRLVVLQLRDEGLLKMKFAQQSPITAAYGIGSSVLTILVQKDLEISEATTMEIGATLNASSVSQEDVCALRWIASAIMRRAGRLSGAAIAAVLIQSGRIPEIGSPSSSFIPSSNASERVCTIENSKISPTKMTNITRESSIAIRTFNKIFGPLGSRKSRPKHTTSKTDARRPIPYPNIDIGVDGSLFEFCPLFEESIWEALEDDAGIGPEALKTVTIGLSQDGSGVGAALAAQSTV